MRKAVLMVGLVLGTAVVGQQPPNPRRCYSSFSSSTDLVLAARVPFRSQIDRSIKCRHTQRAESGGGAAAPEAFAG
jgi:hypothetical protein